VFSGSRWIGVHEIYPFWGTVTGSIGWDFWSRKGQSHRDERGRRWIRVCYQSVSLPQKRCAPQIHGEIMTVYWHVWRVELERRSLLQLQYGERRGGLCLIVSGSLPRARTGQEGCGWVCVAGRLRVSVARIWGSFGSLAGQLVDVLGLTSFTCSAV
jgi:hypothetical protein